MNILLMNYMPIWKMLQIKYCYLTQPQMTSIRDLLKENLNDAAIEALQYNVDFSKLIEDYNEIWG